MGIRKRRFQPQESHCPNHKEGLLCLAGVIGFCKGYTGFQPPHSSPATCPHIGYTCTTFQEAPSWVPLVCAKGDSILGGYMCYPLSFPYPYKEKARQYRSLHFHVCIQGHFLNKSIEQYEYTIFMSQRILELKYIEGNKNNEAWKKWQFRR